MISGNDKYKDFIPSCSYSGNAHARDARKKEKECCKLQARVEELEKWKTIMQSALEAKVRQVRRLLRET